MDNNISAKLESQTWLAPAKLNLFLHIIGQRDDGYHQLQSAIQFIDICDQMQFTLREDGKIRRKNSISNIAYDDDLSVQAAKLLQNTCSIHQGVNIELKKVIPMGAGLGGGSSDAATTLLALNQLWACNLERSYMQELGSQLGADVPVFVRGQACWVEGIGEQLEPIELSEFWHVVVFPNVHLDTKQMFSDSNLTRNCTPIKIRDFLQTKDRQLQTRNVFEPIARRHPEVERVFQWLNQFSPARLTGSGSGMFIVCESQQQASEIAESCPLEWIAFVAKGLNHSPANL